MGSSLRKKLLIGIGGVVGLLVVALFLAPSFYDLNKKKAEFAAEAKKATGRDLVIGGTITWSILPIPSATLRDVKFFNLPGAKNPHMVEIKSVTAKPSLLPLLNGDIELNEVVLVEPKIVLEINAEGKPNWEFAPSVAEAKPAAPKPSSARPLSLGRMVIENGTLLFSDSKAGMTMTAEKANFTASVGSFHGPYGLAGGAVVNGAPLKIDLSVGGKGANGHAMSVALEASGGKLGFKGTLSELGPKARLAGIATVSADQFATFLATLMGLAGQPAPALPPLLAGKFSFDGGIDASQTAFAAKDFKLAIADSSGSGSLSVTLKPALAFDGKVTVPRLDLDKTLAAMSQPAPAPAAGAKPAAPAQTAPPPKESSGGIPSNMTAKLSIDVGEVIYNKGAVRNVAIELDAKGGAVAVPKLTATLPGDMALQARSTMSGDAAKPTVSGDFSLVGPKLRETLAWLAVDVSSLPPNKLTRLSLKGRMASTGGNVQVSNAVFELDDVKGSGGIVVTFGVPLSIVTHVAVDTLDVDSFLAAPAGGQKPASAAPAAPAASAARPPQAGPSIGLKAKVAKLIYNKQAIGGVDVDIALQGSTLKLNDVKVSNLGGARFAVRGNVANYSTPTPRPDIAFNFEAPDMDGVLKVVGAGPSGLGRVTASGGLAGSLEQLTLRDVNLAAMGHTVKATGTLSLPGAAKGPPQSVGYKGSVVLDGQTLEGSVDAKLSGKPNITADLRSPMLDLGKLGGGGAPAAGRGQPAAASKPIDTSGLRSVDANVKLAAATLVMPPLRLSNADLAATLKDGVLTISHFKGALYGGSLVLSGVVNGSQPAMSFDLKGDATSIYLGEMLRGTSGTNQFGSTVKVTIDGRLSATGITLKGSGATSDQIMRSMTGGAQLGGHVFAGADKALLAIGSVATGAAGAVIDNTLGNVLGALGGNRNAASNLLSAISLVLNRFANHDSPISGRIDIAGGVVSDKGLVVQGNRATANVHTRTNLVASTTDTTVNFVIAEDTSAPYLITTVRGPTSRPSFNVVRGSAKDPPGFVNTLTGGSSGTQQQPQQQQQQRSLIPGLPIPNPFGR